jgi:hypothetical protein
VLLCSRCHRTHFGQVFDRSLQIEQPTLATMLWLKSTFDSEFYNREFIRRYHVGNLPKPKMPPANLQTIYLNRGGHTPAPDRRSGLNKVSERQLFSASLELFA